MNKKTDTQLFKELRINTLIIGILMIIIFLATIFIFTELLEAIWYQFMLLIMGLLLISYSLQKYFQENPKVRSIVMIALLILVLLGFILMII